jgi:hypothetical protein
LVSGGRSTPGLREKNPDGLSVKPITSHGITYRSTLATITGDIRHY